MTPTVTPALDFEAAAGALEAMAAVVRMLGARAHEAAQQPPLLKVAEVARRLAVDQATVYRLIKGGELKGTTVAAGAIRVSEGELARFVKVRTA